MTINQGVKLEYYGQARDRARRDLMPELLGNFSSPEEQVCRGEDELSRATRSDPRRLTLMLQLALEVYSPNTVIKNMLRPNACFVVRLLLESTPCALSDTLRNILAEHCYDEVINGMVNIIGRRDKSKVLGEAVTEGTKLFRFVHTGPQERVKEALNRINQAREELSRPACPGLLSFFRRRQAPQAPQSPSSVEMAPTAL